MPKLLMIELNEVNFDFVRAYGKQGKLPRLNALIHRHGLTETTSEDRYERLEPWIQWVTAHTGLTYEQHKVFRLGDIASRTEIDQAWEIIERAGYKVGAVSPMNAHNACVDPAFFIPDPWTRTRVSGPPMLSKIYEAVAQIVGDNAAGRLEPKSLLWLAGGLMRFARPRNYRRYAALALSARRNSWSRAMLLDLFLADLFITLSQKSDVDFATLFLNSAAHIQHHYMFNAAVYTGKHVNPDWYIDRKSDPIYAVYELYDHIIGQIQDSLPSYRLLIATGLHQDPDENGAFYWRLRDHEAFLTEIGAPFDQVEPRMSRDFVIFCADAEKARVTERLLKEAVADDGTGLFDVDNRGTSLFVEFVYPQDINASLGYTIADRHYQGLRDKVAFVAIKNGYHNGIGYLIDTQASQHECHKSIALTDIYQRTVKAAYTS